MKDQLLYLLNQSHKTMTESISKINKIMNQIDQLQEVENDLNRIIDLDLSIFESSLKNHNKNLYENLQVIKQLVIGNIEENLEFVIDDDQIHLMKEAFSFVNQAFLKEIDLLKETIIECQTLQEIKIKLISPKEQFVEKEEVSFLTNYLQKQGWKEEDIISVMLDIVKLNQERNVKKVKTEDVKPTNIDEQELRNLIISFGVSYDQMDQKEILLQYGDLEKIKDILVYLKEKRILKNLNTTASSFSYILAFSNKKIVQEMIELRNNKRLTDSYQELFLHVTDFFEKRIVSKEVLEARKKYQNIYEKNENALIGCYDDFRKNFDYFDFLGLDVREIYRDSHSIFTADHEQLKKNIEIAKIYGVHIDRSLTILKKGQNITVNIDRYLELNLQKYIQEYPSRIGEYSNNLFCNLYYKNKNGEEILGARGIKDIVRLKKATLKPNDPNDIIIENMEERMIQDGIPYKMCSKIASKYDYRYFERCLTDFRMMELENYKVNDYLYQINGVLVSRIKVLKIMSDLLQSDSISFENALLFALTYNSLLGENDYGKIKIFIDELTNKRRNSWNI